MRYLKLALLLVLIASLHVAHLLEPREASALASGCVGFPGKQPFLDDVNSAPSCQGVGDGCYECMHTNPNGPGYILCSEFPDRWMDPDCSSHVFTLDEIPDWYMSADPYNDNP